MTRPEVKPFAVVRRLYEAKPPASSGQSGKINPPVRSSEPNPVPSTPPSSSLLPVPTATKSASYIATAEGVIRAGKIARGELRPVITTDLKALQILAAGEFRRGDYVEAVPLPTDATAKAIVLAARKAKNE
jgi:hypothetical protein